MTLYKLFTEKRQEEGEEGASIGHKKRSANAAFNANFYFFASFPGAPGVTATQLFFAPRLVSAVKIA